MGEEEEVKCQDCKKLKAELYRFIGEKISSQQKILDKIGKQINDQQEVVQGVNETLLRIEKNTRRGMGNRRF